MSRDPRIVRTLKNVPARVETVNGCKEIAARLRELAREFQIDHATEDSAEYMVDKLFALLKFAGVRWVE